MNCSLLKAKPVFLGALSPNQDLNCFMEYKRFERLDFSWNVMKSKLLREDTEPSLTSDSLDHYVIQ